MTLGGDTVADLSSSPQSVEDLMPRMRKTDTPQDGAAMKVGIDGGSYIKTPFVRTKMNKEDEEEEVSFDEEIDEKEDEHMEEDEEEEEGHPLLTHEWKGAKEKPAPKPKKDPHHKCLKPGSQGRITGKSFTCKSTCKQGIGRSPSNPAKWEEVLQGGKSGPCRDKGSSAAKGEIGTISLPKGHGSLKCRERCSCLPQCEAYEITTWMRTYNSLQRTHYIGTGKLEMEQCKLFEEMQPNIASDEDGNCFNKN